MVRTFVSGLILSTCFGGCASIPTRPPDERTERVWRCYGRTDAPPPVTWVERDPRFICGVRRGGQVVAGWVGMGGDVFIVRCAPDGPADALEHELLHAADGRARRASDHDARFYAELARCQTTRRISAPMAAAMDAASSMAPAPGWAG